MGGFYYAQASETRAWLRAQRGDGGQYAGGGRFGHNLYVAPTTGIVVNDKILTGSGSNVGSTTLSILGINMAAINTSNALPGSGRQALSDEWGTDSES
ncbi:MAG: hypothetical protein LIO54_00290 [Oscillospiraceae bacterium]|nr:hypothetical protein [Oscillospiraceae bacterium]